MLRLNDGLKKCSDCDRILSEKQFYRNLASYDGFANVCKSCDYDRRRKYVSSYRGKLSKAKANINYRLKQSGMSRGDYTIDDLLLRFQIVNVTLFKSKCPYCERVMIEEDYFVNMFVPRKHGGLNIVPNIIFCCPLCFEHKRGTHPIIWLPTMGLNFAYFYPLTLPYWKEYAKDPNKPKKYL